MGCILSKDGSGPVSQQSQVQVFTVFEKGFDSNLLFSVCHPYNTSMRQCGQLSCTFLCVVGRFLREFPLSVFGLYFTGSGTLDFLWV